MNTVTTALSLLASIFTAHTSIDIPISRIEKDSYFIGEGGFLFRFNDSGIAFSSPKNDAPLIWIDIAQYNDLRLDQHYIQDVVCARNDQSICLLGFRSHLDSPDIWFSLQMGDPDLEMVQVRELDSAIVHDVISADGGTVLFTRPNDSDGRLHSLNLAKPFQQGPVGDKVFVNQPKSAAFLPSSNGGYNLVAIENRNPAVWSARDLSGTAIGQEVSTGRFFTISGRNIIAAVAPEAASESLTSGSLVIISPSESSNLPWRRARFFTDPGNVIAQRSNEAPSDSLVGSMLGSVLAVTKNDGGYGVKEFCGRPGEVRAIDLSVSLAGFADAKIDPGHNLVVVTGVNRWGDTHQFLVPAPTAANAPIRSCDAAALTVQELTPAADRPTLVLTRYSVQSTQERTPSYVVMGLAGSNGRVLIRPYGAFNSPVQEYAVGEFERQWLASGGRLLVPTLTGDAHPTPWASGRGDYKVATTEDLISVVNDAHSRGIGTAGDYILSGGSAGAFVAAKAALTHPELFRVVLLFSGALDLEVLARTRSDYREIGDPAGGFERWYSGIPAPAEAPSFLLWTAENDERAPSAGSRNFARYVSALGYRGELVISDRGGHNVGTREDTATPVLEFIERAFSK